MSNIIPIDQKLSRASVANKLQVNTIDDLQRLGEILSKSGFFKDCTDAAKAVVKILAGSELGSPAFSSMTGIYIIQGRPALGANLMAAAVKRSGKYDYRVVELSDRICQIEFFQNSKAIGVSEFTAADAQKAGTQNISKFPRNMLFARCLSNGCRWFCPDIFLGAPVYTPEELGATVDEEGNIVELPRTPPRQVDLPKIEPWRQWKSPADAILWAEKQLPDLTMDELQAEFDALPAQNGKKAPAWVKRVDELMLEQF